LRSRFGCFVGSEKKKLRNVRPASPPHRPILGQSQVNDMIDINPMYNGTLAFLMFSGMLLSIVFWAVHNVKKERKPEIGFSTSSPESRSRSGE
jgi:hypothetical protein